MRFLFVYPTRSRRSQFYKTLELYYQMLSGKYPFQFAISMDKNDVTMNKPSVREYLTAKDNLIFAYANNTSKVQAINAGVLHTDFDILVLVSDDMIPWKKDFDDIIAKDMLKYFPNLDGALHYHDSSLSGAEVITFSIIGLKLYERLGYIYHPDYRSLWCDNEFTEVVKKWGKVQYIRRVIVKHKWQGVDADPLAKRNNTWHCDEKTYKKRRNEGFPAKSVYV